MQLQGKVAIVTGASEGIGYAITRSLLVAGSRVCMASRNTEKLRSAVENLDDAEAMSILAVPADVSVEVDVKNIVQQTVQVFGDVDILVNCAGTSLRQPTALQDTSLEEYYRMFGVNVAGIFLMSKEVLPYMKSQNRGYIINILSTASFRTIANNSLYSATKYAARAFTEGLVEENRGTGIRISSISPGPVATSIWTHKIEPPSIEKFDKMLKPGDIASIAMYLLMQPDYVFIDNIIVTP